MDRSGIKQKNSVDRTVIDTWKAEEKSISDNLYKKISALNLLYAPTDDFREIFKTDMFIKGNPKAFFIVMHYLFNILDPVEFKKRFYWPIVDKKHEASFRSSTVQYLNHINERHNLKWSNIKSYLFVTPGGMKFLLFLTNFVDFIVRELIKHREKCLNIETNKDVNTDFDVIKQKLQFKCLKDNALEYVNEIEMFMKSYKEKSEYLRKTLNELSENTKIPFQEIISKKFIEDFKISNEMSYKNNIKAQIDMIKSLEEPLNKLKQTNDSHQVQGSSVSYNKESAKKSLKTIQLLHHEAKSIEFHSHNEPEMQPLIRVFNIIHPEIKANLENLNEKPMENVIFQNQELHKLVIDLNQLENQITTFIRKNDSNQNLLKTPLHSLDVKTNKDFISKFVNTPPIKFDMFENKANPRLPLLDDYANRLSDDSFSIVSQNTICHPKTTPLNDTIISINQTVCNNKTKIIDPLKLLKSLHKDASRARSNCQNLSSLALKWKEKDSFMLNDDMQSSILGGDDKNNSPMLSPVRIDDETITMNTPETISFISPKASQNSILRSSILDTSFSYQKKHHGIQKLQEATFNLLNLSSSPSGRLESLIDQKEFPKILLNDLTLNDSNIKKNEALSCPSSIVKESQVPSIILDHVVENEENEANKANTFYNIQNEKSFNIGGDTIFNISDSVLKNVPM